MKRAIREHRKDFGAIIFLLVLSIGVSGYVLVHERLRLPFIEQSTEVINAELSTAKSITPGQGQYVTISGVQIGLITDVHVRNGYAVIQMKIQEPYAHAIHTDATALVRPRTGLDDMLIEIDPGSKSAPIAPAGYTIPLSNTLPLVDNDEILHSLDADTRAYLQLLINGAGEGLKGQGGTELGQVLERMLPTHRDLARVNQAVAVRGEDLRQLVNSLQRLNTALASKQTQISQLVNSSSTVFRAFASEDSSISRAIADLPGTLSQTTTTLGKAQRFAELLAPAATNLQPAARALPAANAALRALAIPSTPIVRDQIRPFVVAARPLVRSLRPASINLAKATPNLGNVFNVLGHLVNMAAYNTEPSGQHSYLYWLAWLGHNGRSLFSTQDANGTVRPLFVEANCSTYATIAEENPIMKLVLNSLVQQTCHLP